MEKRHDKDGGADRQQPGRSAIPKHAVEKYTKERKQ